AEATAAGVDAICMLFKGAGRTCTSTKGVATSDGRTIGVSAVLESTTGPSAFQALHLRIDVNIDGQPRPELTTRTIAYGGSEPQALKKGFHEWAVMAGVALVDLVIADPARPALKALEPDATALQLGGFDVYRGFPIVKVGKNAATIDHELLVAALEPIAGELSSDRAHALDVRLDRSGSKSDWTCKVDAIDSPRLCDLAKTYTWPNMHTVSAKLIYVLAPPAQPAP
ncbi:MAG: hypothetical protein ACI9MC_001301, partial [Kiritimatiellia bacterium]